MSAQLAALVGAHLSDRRRSLLAWGVPLGLWSAFIVIIFPSVEGALSKAVQSYPPALKEAFGIGELTSVEFKGTVKNPTKDYIRQLTLRELGSEIRALILGDVGPSNSQ